MITISPYDENHFLYNDDLQPRVFRAYCNNEILSLIPTSNAVGGIFNINMRNLEIEGKTFDDFANTTELKNEIQKIVFNKGGAGSSSGALNHVYLDQNGDDESGKIEDFTKPFATIDAAISAFNAAKPRENNTLNHTYATVVFLSSGSYDWNLIPERNIVIDPQRFHVEIDFSNSPNLLLTESQGIPFNLIIRGDHLTLKNHSENRIAHGLMNLYGACDIIDTQRSGFGGFSHAFITAGEIKLKYNLIIGNGNVFKTYGSDSSNEFIGNIAANGNMCVNNQGNGHNVIDFDTATSTGKLILLKVSLPGKTATIHFGDCRPTSLGSIVEAQDVFVNCKPNAKIYGLLIGKIHLTGNKLEAFSTIGRLGSEFFISNMHIICNGHLVTGFSDVPLTISDSIIELAAGALYYIETHTDYTNPLVIFKGHNTILHQVPGSSLFVKFITARPTGVKVKQFTQNGLKSNAILNAIVAGDEQTPLLIETETTNTY